MVFEVGQRVGGLDSGTFSHCLLEDSGESLHSKMPWLFHLFYDNMIPANVTFLGFIVWKEMVSLGSIPNREDEEEGIWVLRNLSISLCYLTRKFDAPPPPFAIIYRISRNSSCSLQSHW